MEDHWQLEPGVDPRRARLMWFMRVGDHPQVAELARRGQQRLAGLDGLDLVPQQWLHVTTLIAGFADEITADQRRRMAAEAGRLLARTPAVTITLGRVLYHSRAIMLGVGPWTPHITLAYSNTAGPARPAIDALGRELPSQQAAVTSISLLSQAPEQMWTWHLVTDVPFGTELTGVRESR
jgi:2'-5' RNA ligase